MTKRFLSTLAFLLIVCASAYAEKGTVKHFRGTIDKKLQVYVRLERTNDSLFGDYIYLSQGKPISVRGAYKNNHFVIYEFTDGSFTVMSGKFEGDMSGDTMKGIWRSMANPNEGHPFTFIRSGSTVRTIASREQLTKPFETPDSIVTVECHFPMLTQLKNFDVSEKVNRFLDERLRSYSVEGKMPELGSVKDSMGWFMQTDYSIDYISATVASFTVSTSEFTGGVHPNYWTTHITLDLNTGKQLAIKDCLNTGNLKAINKLITESALECGAAEGEDAKCLEIAPEETNFSISPEGLKLFKSDCYSYASIACATIEVPLPKLKKYIKSSGIVKELR
jgi:hypothetical protein